ncbi:hypothetical protein AVEN_238917-1 [Araneus ventricosus]|uniref:Uncharacterized protein n=1 Tax=Araneus ventricosus TaxID=182803 RepID=A0A4Y2VX30_ARAVE|nr:hypothetical protein AVEN_238917-1 [Araneus ventricosus]
MKSHNILLEQNSGLEALTCSAAISFRLRIRPVISLETLWNCLFFTTPFSNKYRSALSLGGALGTSAAYVRFSSTHLRAECRILALRRKCCSGREPHICVWLLEQNVVYQMALLFLVSFKRLVPYISISLSEVRL